MQVHSPKALTAQVKWFRPQEHPVLPATPVREEAHNFNKTDTEKVACLETGHPVFYDEIDVFPGVLVRVFPPTPRL